MQTIHICSVESRQVYRVRDVYVAVVTSDDGRKHSVEIRTDRGPTKQEGPVCISAQEAVAVAQLILKEIPSGKESEG